MRLSLFALIALLTTTAAFAASATDSTEKTKSVKGKTLSKKKTAKKTKKKMTKKTEKKVLTKTKTEKKMVILHDWYGQEWKGQYDGPAAPGHEIAMDQNSWKALCAKVGLSAPVVDFSTAVAVGVFVGEKPTGGYGANFEDPATRGDDLIVRYRIKKPSGFATQAFTQPWKIMVFPRPKGKVLVEHLPQ